MVFLNSFTFPSGNEEYEYFRKNKTAQMTYNPINPYPFRLLSAKGLGRLDFSDITILYGGNGSGKSTALNMMAEALMLNRVSPFNKTPYTDDFVSMCSFPEQKIPRASRIITSDDVFDNMLTLRGLNSGIDRRRKSIYDEWYEIKSSRTETGKGVKFDSFADYDALRLRNEVKRSTSSSYINARVEKNIAMKSNGESAFAYFTSMIEEDALYFLDEPENSLSPALTTKLASFISDSARFYRCQFVIATHSPFILALKNAKIYDLDASPAVAKKWTELENVRLLFDFFREHEHEFSEKY